ncbi:beta galactosidase small chain [Clostridium sp. CAG:167]|nr:beta galactosidase small chain [Clostridium sp. CAG:167]
MYEVEGLPVTPYMLPQECGMHSRTKWVEIRRRTELDNRNKEWKTTTLRVEAAEDEMYFSCLPYTAEELESATHQEELPRTAASETDGSVRVRCRPGCRRH